MKTHRFSIGIIAALLAASLVTSARAEPSTPTNRAAPATPRAGVGTAFTYRGQLKNGGAPINANCDTSFSVFDAVTDGNLVAGPLSQVVAVARGLFATSLDFGEGVFTGETRWLGLEVRCPAGAGAFTALDPRQEVTAVPNAILAGNANLFGGQAPAAFVDVAGAQEIVGVKTFASGVRFSDGTVLNSA